MNVQHKKVFWIISTLLLIIVVVSLWMEHKQDQKYTNRIRCLERKANNYEVQIKQIQNEMNAKQRKINRENIQAWVLPCYVVRTVSQLEQADKWIDKFEDIAIEPAHWYHGSNLYTTRAFASSLTTTMSSARMVMTSSPSKGRGGRSFSGGGGGAGGHSSGGGFR